MILAPVGVYKNKRWIWTNSTVCDVAAKNKTKQNYWDNIVWAQVDNSYLDIGGGGCEEGRGRMATG